MRILSARTLALALALALLPVPGRAQGDEVQRYLMAAARLYENLEYERALEQLGRAKKFSRSPEDDVSIALYEGIILADLGKREESAGAFRAALLLKIDAQLPVRVSPKVAKEFETLRGEVKRELGPNHSRPRPAYTPSAKLAEQSPGAPVVPLTLGGAAVVAAGVGAYFGLQANAAFKAAEGEVFQSTAYNEHYRPGQTSATLANVLFATAGAALAGSVLTFFLTGRPAAGESAAAGASR